ncbi:MAG: lysophospholipid acyltransferase family protein [Rickettsiales bacterium]|nr:lysophospholipid acyltransferase family protein [Rickettsiales bacterium]
MKLEFYAKQKNIADALIYLARSNLNNHKFKQNLNLIKLKIKNIRYIVEALLVRFGLWFFSIIGLNNASKLAAKIAVIIGKKIPVHQLAYKNLSNALPNLNEIQKEKILDDMWDNLGRVVGEYPHVARFSEQELRKFVKITDETIDNIAAMKNGKKGGIIFSGHFSNWELGPKLLSSFGLKVGTVYRPLNNPYVEKMTAAIRGTEMITKSAQGNRRIIEIIKNGGYVLIMADQKISEGEAIQFFHDTAVTTTAIARIALKYNAALIPARIIRTAKAFEFCGEVEKPLEIQRSDNINEDVFKLTLAINRKLESWITQYPAQWFWVHNRWKK